MTRCEKCGTILQGKDVVYWKCTECDKTFKVDLPKLRNINGLKSKAENANKSLLKCPSCGKGLDNGDEQIFCKCSSCGNIIKGNLKFFAAEDIENIPSDTAESVTPSSGLVKCPECGKDISKKARKCVHCGKVLIENSPDKLFCSDCGKEIPEKATECPNCGCPVEDTEFATIKPYSLHKTKKVSKKILIPILSVIIIVAIALPIYYINVVRPKKIEAQNKATYEEAIALLERGKYEDGNELLQTITEYKDVNTILEQIKWESYVYECINDYKEWLKNPDSFTLYEVAFYLDDESHGMYASLLGDVDFSYPAVVFHSGAQNGFGGNTTGYELFYYFIDEGYTCVGSCDTLNEDDYYNDKGELKDKDDGAMDVLLCMEINALIEDAEHVGNVDMTRIKALIKNDAYSAIKIIE